MSNTIVAKQTTSAASRLQRRLRPSLSQLGDPHKRDSLGADGERLKLPRCFQSLSKTVAYCHPHGVMYRRDPANLLLSYSATLVVHWAHRRYFSKFDKPSIRVVFSRSH
jgi:hypothetical protein